MFGINLRSYSVNFNVVKLRNLILYFSYETIVGFADKDKAYVMQNQWGTTTGKHLNIIANTYSIDRKKESLSKEDFEKKLEEVLKKHNLI